MPDKYHETPFDVKNQDVQLRRENHSISRSGHCWNEARPRIASITLFRTFDKDALRSQSGKQVALRSPFAPEQDERSVYSHRQEHARLHLITLTCVPALRSHVTS